MIKKTLWILAVSLVFLVGCGGQNNDSGNLNGIQNSAPHNIDGVWEYTQINESRRLEINGNQFVMTICNRSYSWPIGSERMYEDYPIFDAIEVGEIDFDTYFLLTGRSVNPDVYKIEITSVSQHETIIERIPTRRKSIWFMQVDEHGALARTAQNFEELIELYKHEPGFAIAENIEFTRHSEIDFHTFYLLTGTEVDENYVYRIVVFSADTREVYELITGYVKNISFRYINLTTTRRDGTFILMDDGRKEVIWNDTWNVELFNFDQTPNTITFAGRRYQRGS